MSISFRILVIPTSSSHWHMLVKPDILVVYLQSLDALGTRFHREMKKMLSKGQVEERWRASPNPSKCQAAEPNRRKPNLAPWFFP